MYVHVRTNAPSRNGLSVKRYQLRGMSSRVQTLLLDKLSHSKDISHDALSREYERSFSIRSLVQEASVTPQFAKSTNAPSPNIISLQRQQSRRTSSRVRALLRHKLSRSRGTNHAAYRLLDTPFRSRGTSYAALRHGAGTHKQRWYVCTCKKLILFVTMEAQLVNRRASQLLSSNRNGTLSCADKVRSAMIPKKRATQAQSPSV